LKLRIGNLKPGIENLELRIGNMERRIRKMELRMSPPKSRSTAGNSRPGEEVLEMGESKPPIRESNAERRARLEPALEQHSAMGDKSDVIDANERPGGNRGFERPAEGDLDGRRL
jgi:hypothetical protein